MSQAVNDWYDRHVDAINEPNRPIPSGRMPGRWGLYIAIVWSLLSLAVAALIGPVVFWAACFGVATAWAYSAPPLRLKQNGWWGNAAVGLCYEGLPWFTGAAALLGGVPPWPILILALLYSLGAHGIMTLNDFKAIEGDQRMGVRSLPVQLGVQGAARVACAVMALPQVVVIALLLSWDRPFHAAGVSLLLLVQLVMMRRFLADPMAKALWYSGFGVPLYVLGMLVSAFAVRGLGEARMASSHLGWFGIVRLGLVQAALGAIVVLTTSTINRVMIVELALPAMVPGLFVTWHYALQVLRPSWGHGSDKGGRRTPWIIAGMAALAVGRLRRGGLRPSHGAEHGGGRHRRHHRLHADRRRRGCRGHQPAGAAGQARGRNAPRGGGHHRVDHDDRGLHHHGGTGRAVPRPVLDHAADGGGGRHLRHRLPA